jgi:transcriptional regulator with XRE-family HTH domain
MGNDYIRILLSSNLKKLRKRRDLSQAELAKMANVSTNFVSEIERSIKWPYPKTLQNLAEALGVEVFEFFKPADSENPNIEEYINRFSTDTAIIVEKSIKNAFSNIKKQYSGYFQA